MNRIVFVLTLAAMCVTAMGAQVRPLPPLIAACDPGELTAAKLGRDRLLAAAGIKSDAIVCVTGGGIAAVGGAAADRPARAAALLDAAGVNVANLAHRDLAGDPAGLAVAIKSAKTKFVSASFKMLPGTATPWTDVAFIECGGKKFAVIGIAAESSAETGAFAGLVYVKPKEALAQALGEIGDAAGVIVLADMPLADVRNLLEGAAAVDAIIVSGRGGGATMIPGQPRVFRAPAGGGAIGVIAQPTGVTAALLDPSQPCAAFNDAVAKLDASPAPVTEAAATESHEESTVTIPAIVPGQMIPVGASGQNRAVKLSIKSIGLLDHYGQTAAPDGLRFLVLDAAFQNVLLPEVVRDQHLPVEYQVPQLYDHLYVVADATVLRRHDGDTFPGELPADRLDLPRMGTTAAGKIVLAVPADFSAKELTVRFYDFTHGHIIVPIITGSSGQEIKALSPPQKNEVMGAGEIAMTKSAEFGGQNAPVGMTFVMVDLRMRSLLTYEADATIFDPHAKPGDKMKIGTVADWKESRKYTQLVADGQFAYSPLDSSPMAPEPRFLPDVFTGGKLVFLAPKKTQSLSLRCDFPNVALNGEVKEIHPAGFDIPLEGKTPDIPKAKGIAEAKDSVFDVLVVGQASAGKFADVAADDGQKFVVLDVVVANLSDKGEFFQTKDQLKYATESGDQLGFDDASYQGPHRPWDLLFIPQGQSRAFQVAYRVGESESKPRLAYASPDEGGSKVLSLPVLAK